MTIGNAAYRCSCVRYIPKDNIAWILAVLGGPSLSLIIFVIAVVIFVKLYRSRQRKLSFSKTTKYEADKQDSKRLSDDSGKSAKNSKVNNYEFAEYCKQLPHDYDFIQTEPTQRSADYEFIDDSVV